MKKIAFLLIVFFANHIATNAQTVPVTFHFDARNTPFTVINFFGGDTLVDDDGDGIFELTLDLEPGQYDYLYWMNNSLDNDPDNPNFRNGHQSSTMRISDPMVSYLLPKDGDIMRENRIRADFAYTPENPPLSSSIQLIINGKSVDNAENYFDAKKRTLQIDNPPFITDGENIVVVSYETNKGLISRTSTFTYHALQLMIDDRVYRMDRMLAWGRVLTNPYPESVFVKCNDAIYEAPVNQLGYFGVEVKIGNGENNIGVAYTEAELSHPVDQTNAVAALRHKWWIELTGTVSNGTVSIEAVPQKIENASLSYEWTEAERNPESLNLSGSTSNLSFPLPEKEGEYTIELHAKSSDGETYVARKILVNKGNPHFLGLHEKAEWMETAVYQEIDDYFDWGTYSFGKLAKVIPHIKECGITMISLPPFNEGGFIAKDHFKFDDEAGLIELIETAHEYGIRIMLDFGFGHVGPYHKFVTVNNKLPGQAMPYDHFVLWKGEPGLSEHIYEQGPSVIHLDLENEFTQEYIIKLAEFWIEKYDVDGYRFDSGQEAVNRSPEFQTQLITRIKNIKPDAWILVEGDDRDNLDKPDFSYYNYGDAVYDWGLNVEWGGGPYGFPGVFKGIYTTDQFHELILSGIPPDSGLVMRYANVDYFDYVHNRYGWEQERTALSIVFSTYGLVSLKSGEEVGAAWAKGTFDLTDPLGVMPFYQRLISMRKQLLGNYPQIERVTVSNSDEIYAFTSWRDTSMVLTVSNFTSSPKQVEINLSDAAFQGKRIKYWSEITDEEEKTFNGETTTTINLDGWESKVFVLNYRLENLFPSIEGIDLFSVNGEYTISENGKVLGFDVLKTPTNSISEIEWLIESSERLATINNGILTPCGCGSGEVTVIARSKQNPDIEARKTVIITNQSSGELLNANFNNGVDDWLVQCWSGCNVTAKAEDGEALIFYNETSIENCSANFTNMAYLNLEKDKFYKIGFTAHSSVPKSIAIVVDDKKSGNGLCWSSFDVDNEKKQYYVAFKMNEPTTNSAQLFFNFAGNSDSLWIDNVSLCETESESVSVAVTLQINMQNEDVSPDGIFIKGSWDNWTNGIEMQNVGSTVYEATINVNALTRIDYRFINGNPDGGGASIWEEFIGDCTDVWTNRFFQVQYTDTVLETVCFNSCEACLEPETVNITFQVDMQELQVSSGVYLRGSFNSWNSNEPLENKGTVYFKTVELTPGETIEYKFVNGSQWEESIPSKCSYGNTGNRQLIVPNNDYTLDAVCFNSCEVCDITSPDSVFITFWVNMQNEQITDKGVYLNGSFCGWYPDQAIKMNEFMTAEYSYFGARLKLYAGQTIEYKFVNGEPDNWSRYETLNGLPCAFGNDANRGFVVPNEDADLNVVCFGECERCDPGNWVNELPTGVKVYPNPADDYLTIEGLNQLDVEKISLFSLDGKLIVSEYYSGQNCFRVTLEDISKGTFLLAIFEKNAIYTCKILKK